MRSKKTNKIRCIIFEQFLWYNVDEVASHFYKQAVTNVKYNITQNNFTTAFVVNQ